MHVEVGRRLYLFFMGMLVGGFVVFACLPPKVEVTAIKSMEGILQNVHE